MLGDEREELNPLAFEQKRATQEELDELLQFDATESVGEFDESTIEALTTKLYPHQRKGIAWMIEQERNSCLPPFFERRNEGVFDKITRTLFKRVRPLDQTLRALSPLHVGLICRISTRRSPHQ